MYDPFLVIVNNLMFLIMRNEIDLRLCIWDYEDITHEQITELTGVVPFKVYEKGKKKNPNFGALAKQNGWLMKGPFGNYDSFEEQMDALLDILEVKSDVFRPLLENYYSEISCALYIYVDSEESTPYVHLNERHMRILQQMNIEFDLDIILLAKREE